VAGPGVIFFSALNALKFAANIHYKFKSNQASKAMLQSSKHTSAKQFNAKMVIQGHVF